MVCDVPISKKTIDGFLNLPDFRGMNFNKVSILKERQFA